jgi:hypothetical protein
MNLGIQMVKERNALVVILNIKIHIKTGGKTPWMGDQTTARPLPSAQQFLLDATVRFEPWSPLKVQVLVCLATGP